jgi:hypothetical protein
VRSSCNIYLVVFYLVGFYLVGFYLVGFYLLVFYLVVCYDVEELFCCMLRRGRIILLYATMWKNYLVACYDVEVIILSCMLRLDINHMVVAKD